MKGTELPREAILRDVSVPGMTISKHTKFAVGNADCKDTHY